MILSNFPVPYKDELLYSVVARFAAMLKYPSRKCVLRDAFGTATVTASIEFPARLRVFISRLPDGHSCAREDVIEKHTLFPWYASFMEPERRQRLRTAMLEGRGECTWGLVGLQASSVRVPPVLRYCPECLRQDSKSGIAPHWRRLHQLTGLDVCPIHAVLIEESSVPRLNRLTRHEFNSPDRELLDVTARPCDASGALIRVSRLGESLIRNSPFEVSRDQVRLNIVNLLRNRGFATMSGTIKVTKLSRALRHYFPELFIQAVGGTSWISRVGQKDRPLAPIQYLSLLALASGEIQDLFVRSESLVLRSGPNCTNPLCPKQGTSTVFEGAEHSPDHDSPLELFACSECGRRFACCATSREKVWVRDYGPLWRARLKDLWIDPAWTLRGIGRALWQDPITIKREAFKTGLPFPRRGSRVTTTKGLKLNLSRNTLSFSEIRNKWSTLRAEHPSKGRADLRKLAPAVHASLYRRDSTWLFDNSPPPAPSGSRNQRVDWRQRDKELSQNLVRVRNEMSSASPPQRISSKAILRNAGGLMWESKLALMPQSVRLLQELAENRISFAVRRVQRVTNAALHAGKRLQKWRVVRAAGLRPDLLANEIVKATLESSVQKLTAAAEVRAVPRQNR